MPRYTVNINGKINQVDVIQSGYHPSGRITSAALLKFNSNPLEEEIEAAMSGNLYRCGTYLRIRKAIKTAANT